MVVLEDCSDHLYTFHEHCASIPMLLDTYPDRTWPFFAAVNEADNIEQENQRRIYTLQVSTRTQ